MSHRIFYSNLSVAYLWRPYEVGGKSDLPGGMSDMPGGMSDLPSFLVLVLLCRMTQYCVATSGTRCFSGFSASVLLATT